MFLWKYDVGFHPYFLVFFRTCVVRTRLRSNPCLCGRSSFSDQRPVLEVGTKSCYEYFNIESVPADSHYSRSRIYSLFFLQVFFYFGWQNLENFPDFQLQSSTNNNP